MYKNKSTFYPNNLYVDINFNKVKERVKGDTGNCCQDYKSIFIINTPNYILMLNNIGKIQFFYNNLDKSLILKKVKEIENAYKEQVEDFQIVYQ